MAHTLQARKRIRQDAARQDVNSAQRSRVRTVVKKLEAAIDGGMKNEIPAAFKAAMSELHSGARKGIITKGAADRKISRLAARVKTSA